MGDMGEYWRDVKQYYRDRQVNPEKHFSKQEIQAYKKRQEKRINKSENAKKEIHNIAQELGIELKIYPSTGQYSFGNILDWWTTTGTVIVRKTKERFDIGFYNTQELRKVLQNILDSIK